MPKRPVDIVTDFYHALSANDVDVVVAAVDDHFAEDVSIEWPPSLPHGGRVEGVRKLRAVFRGAADPNAPAGAKNMKLLGAIGDGDDVVAWISFDWTNPGEAAGTPNEALEKWSFAGDTVREIRAFYWNTDAIPTPTRA